MKLSVAFLALAIAAPILCSPTPGKPSCERKRSLRKRCEFTGCIISVGFTSAVCAAAAAEEGLSKCMFRY
ncbi:hypothetical protein BD410DRAFT_2429 [Rickenella mellea]|uniref:Extracellular membrane protein CFEM domain-containing protein n=1 Tax=Rickenella mellea TaxID=50990 RepID=A0A4R5XET1_9AGAM|nr:hypothetical protein BD410DRAFT_2429 [Rickenella mellea]